MVFGFNCPTIAESSVALYCNVVFQVLMGMKTISYEQVVFITLAVLMISQIIPRIKPSKLMPLCWICVTSHWFSTGQIEENNELGDQNDGFSRGNFNCHKKWRFDGVSFKFNLSCSTLSSLETQIHHWFRKWLVACSAQSHYLNQCAFIFSIEPWGTDVIEMLMKHHTFSFKMRLKMSSPKQRSSRLGFNVLRQWNVWQSAVD